MSTTLAPIPFPIQTPIARRRRAQYAPGTDPFEDLCDEQWFKSFTSISQVASVVPQSVSSPATFDNQAAAIPTTDFSAIIGVGTYRVSWFLTATVVGAGNVQVLIGFTDHGTPKSYAGAVMALAALVNFQSDTVTFTVDANTTITYQTVYVAPGQYALKLVLERLP